ncbi:MAG: hypothetical protein U5L09_04955 [Bacteroidales bacterium]|nr:hypothetical protein [Bacteroidales bacterium]
MIDPLRNTDPGAGRIFLRHITFGTSQKYIRVLMNFAEVPPAYEFGLLKKSWRRRAGLMAFPKQRTLPGAQLLQTFSLRKMALCRQNNMIKSEAGFVNPAGSRGFMADSGSVTNARIMRHALQTHARRNGLLLQDLMPEVSHICRND